MKFAQELKKKFEEDGKTKIVDIISSEDDLLQALETENDINGVLIATDLARKLEDNRLDRLTDVLLHIRKTFPDLTLSLLSSERAGHPMLAELVDMGIYNIFLKGTDKITIEVLNGSFERPKTFTDAIKYKDVDHSIPWRKSFSEHQRLVVEVKREKERENQKAPNSDAINSTGNDTQLNLAENEQLTVSRALTERKIILVISPFQRTGSTFVAHQLAYQIAQQKIGVRYFENPFKLPYTYDRLAGHHHAPNYQSQFFEKEDDDDDELESEWIREGVSIHALNPVLEDQVKEEKDFSLLNFLRFLLSAHDSPYFIIDIGSDSYKKFYKELIDIASHVLVVVDGDIARLEVFEHYKSHPEFEWIHKVLTKDKTVVVANRFAKGLEDFLPAERYVPVPNFPSDTVFKAQLEGSFKFDTREGKKLQSTGFSELLNSVLDKNERLLMQKGSTKLKVWKLRSKEKKSSLKEKVEESK